MRGALLATATPLNDDTADATRAADGDGDDVAFERIMRRYNRMLFRTARSILKSDAEAEDALQEAYLRAWRALARTVAKLGGKAVQAKVKYNVPVDQLKWPADVLKFAVGLEQGAVSAYVCAVPLFGNRDVAKAAANILGDEAMHWAILRQALGDAPVPVAFVS